MGNNFDLAITLKAIDRVTKPLRVVERATDRYYKSLNRLSEKAKQLSGNMKRLGMDMSLKLTTPLAALGFMALNTSGKFEQLKTDFEVMLGSADKANKLFNQVKEFSASTPFQMPGLANNAKKLLAFGIEQENVISILNKLGDTAGGNSQKMETLVDAYGKISASGKASMEDINRVTDAGVPILKVLAKQLDTTVLNLREKMIPAGEVTREVFDEAFTSMTSKGGMFYQGMKKQSKTLFGLFSTFKDNAIQALGTLGDTMAKTFNLKDKLKGAIEFMKKLNGFIEKHPQLTKMFVVFTSLLAITGPLIIGLGVLTASLSSIIAFTPRFIIFIQLMKKWQIATKLLTAAQWLLNVALNANPIGLIVTGIAALAGLGYVVYKNWKPISDFFTNLWKSIENGVSGALNALEKLSPISTGIKAVTQTVNFVTGKIPSYDVGSWNIPNDQLAMVHKGEMILPQPIADRVRNNKQGTTSQGSVSVHYNPVIHLNGKDIGVKDELYLALKNHKNEILKIVQEAQRDQTRLAF